MTFSKMIGKFLSTEAKALVRSGIRSNIKKKASEIFKKFTSKSPEQIREEMIEMIGYETLHYSLGKDQEIKFKSSSVFVNEWLKNNPKIKQKIFKDEESGQIYFENKPWSNELKLNLIDSFVRETKIQSPNVSGHFDQALKLIDVSDFNAIKFKNHFSKWDPKNESVIDSWLDNCFPGGLATDSKYASLLFKKWIVGTAKRAISPGTSLDGCLTLQGPAGVGKTQFFRQLLPEPFETRTGEILCNIKDPKKFAESIIGKTVACFDELSILEQPKVVETFKQLLTLQNIDVRLAYRRDPQRYALRQGFCATTNSDRFIKDPSLSRRLWVIQLNGNKRLDFDFLNQNKQDLWNEAVYLAEQGYKFFLTEEEQKMVEENNKVFLFAGP